jgi:methylated-DNA-[protein]-cysteine S-methyltransferase
MTHPNPAAPALVAVITETPLGWAGVALSPAGIRHATLFHTTPAAAARELRAFDAVEGHTPLAADASARLQAYAAGQPGALDEFPVDLPPQLPATSRRVLLSLREIPPGEVRTYGWLAEHTGLGRANARAVGAIIGANPVPLWLPCHRVVAADGSLHGFAGGLAMKRRLLQLEGALPAALLP